MTAFQPKDWEEIAHESDGPYKPPSYLCSSTFFPLCLAGRGCHLLIRAELFLLASLSKWQVGPFSSPTIRNTHFNLWVSTTKPYTEWVQRHFVLLILSPPFTDAKTNKQIGPVIYIFREIASSNWAQICVPSPQLQHFLSLCHTLIWQLMICCLSLRKRYLGDKQTNLLLPQASGRLGFVPGLLVGHGFFLQ